MDVRQFLETKQVAFGYSAHPIAHRAEDVARVLEVPPGKFAKTVLVNADDEFMLVLLPATHRICLSTLGDCLGAESVELATEEEMTLIFPDCERGVAPPFGWQYGLTTVVDESLADDEHIVFESNSHEEAVYMRYADYQRLEQPRVESFAIPA